ncbi:MAG: hypothetical protein ABSA94_20960, partial [Acidobacteriaceae bacterium]
AAVVVTLALAIGVNTAVFSLLDGFLLRSLPYPQPERVAALVALPATVGLAHFFRSQLYGVSTWDPVTLAAAMLLTAVMVALASALPARRATAVDPMEALRSE